MVRPDLPFPQVTVLFPTFRFSVWRGLFRQVDRSFLADASALETRIGQLPLT